MDRSEITDYRLRLCPSELAELPETEMPAEVCQIVEEAFERQFTIRNQAMRENLLVLLDVGSMPSEIFEPDTVPLTEAGQLSNQGTLFASRTKRRVRCSPTRRMPGSFVSDHSDGHEETDSPPTYEDVVNRDKIHNEVHQECGQIQGLRLRPISDVSQSSSSPSTSFSAIDSSSSKTSIELPETLPYTTMQTNGQDQTKRGGPRHWIKNTLAKTQHSAAKATDDCLACVTEFPVKHLVELTCPEKHRYCRPCFERLVKSRCQSESVFPPQCCQVEVPADLVKSHVSRGTRKMYIALEKIASIAPDERWYCPHPRCLKALNIKSAEISQKGAKCPHCRNHICVSCKQQAHLRDADCADGALKATLRTSKHKGWQTCYKCGEMIELTDGCRHITCRCKAEFCYVCLRKWPQCVNNYDCVQKLERIKKQGASVQESPSQSEMDLPIVSAPTNQPKVEASRSGNVKLLVDMTEEEQIAYAMQETLREAEEAETKRVVEESERAAAAVAIVEFMQERERVAEQERAQRRHARVERRFRYFESQMHEIKAFQENLITERHLQDSGLENSSRLGIERDNDMQWLHRMHAERLAILAEDKALLMQDPSFSLHSYRRSARLQRAVEEGLSSLSAAKNTTEPGRDSTISRGRLRNSKAGLITLQRSGESNWNTRSKSRF